MMQSRIMRESVTVRRAAAVHHRGTSEPDWDNASSHVLRGVSVQETQGTIDMAGRDAANAMATMYAQKDADIMRGDRVEAHGRTWTVTGEPRKVGVGHSLQHVACSLQEWEG